MNTKKISELTMMETVSDAANVLVEENGEAKRVPAGKILPESWINPLPLLSRSIVPPTLSGSVCGI